MNSSEWAAWVQAVGAVVTIGATVVLARSDRRASKAKDHAVARSAAIALVPEMVEVLAQLEWGITQVESGAAPERIGNTGPTDEDSIRFWNLPVLPPSLEALRPYLQDLGEASKPAQHAYFLLQRLRDVFRDFGGRRAFDGPIELWSYEEDEWAKTLAQAKQAKSAAEKALKAIGRLVE
ncbi:MULTISPECIES: hypothetical protein [unclassified Luteibacter]|uniref:hypothetical protein n=1 Tax=Luteibacter sp. PvP019 TaxID=3156436 RepID=UPI003392B976